MPENNDSIELVYDEEGAKKFNDANGNEARRQVVLEEFSAGRFSDASHINFFLEQYNKGEISLNTDEEKRKLAQLLDGIEGYKNLSESYTLLSQRRLTNSMWKAPSYTGSMESMDNPNFNKNKEFNDFGLGNIDKENAKNAENQQKKKAKKDFNALLAEAQKAAVERQFTGKVNNDLRHAIQAEKDKCKWYQLKRKRQLEKADRDIDPSTYWGTKKVYANPVTRVYYSMRDKMSSSRGNRVQRLKDRLNEVVELQSVDASTRWLSTKFGTKFITKAKLMLRRSPERLTQKIVANANAWELDAIIRQQQEKLNALPPFAGTKLQQQQLDKDRKNLQNIINSCHKRQQDLMQKKDNMQATIDMAYGGRVPEYENKTAKRDTFFRNLETTVHSLQAQISEEMLQDPRYQAYLKLHDGKKPENFRVEEHISTDKLMDMVLKEKGLDEQKIAAIKESYVEYKNRKEKKEKTTENESFEKSIDEQTPVNEVAAAEQAPINEAPTVKQMPVNEAAPVKQTPKTPPLPEKTNVGNKAANYYAGNTVLTGMSETYANGDKMQLNIAKDQSRYDLITTDKNGKQREPTQKEIENLVRQLKDNHIPNVELEDSFSVKTQQAFLAELDKQKIAVINREEVNKRLNEKTTEEKQPSKEQSKEPVMKGNSPEQQGEHKLPDIKQVLLNVVNNSKDEKEQLAKLKIIEKIQSGEFEKSGEGYLNFMKEVNTTFGEKTPDALTLGEIAADKALKQDLKEAAMSKEDKTSFTNFVKETKEQDGISAKDSSLAFKVSETINLANKYKTLEEMKQDGSYKQLPQYAKQGVENLFHLEHASENDNSNKLTNAQKAQLRGQILGQVIERKNQRKDVTQKVQKRTLDKSLVQGKSSREDR